MRRYAALLLFALVAFHWPLLGLFTPLFKAFRAFLGVLGGETPLQLPIRTLWCPFPQLLILAFSGEPCSILAFYEISTLWRFFM